VLCELGEPFEVRCHAGAEELRARTDELLPHRFELER